MLSCFILFFLDKFLIQKDSETCDRFYFRGFIADKRNVQVAKVSCFELFLRNHLTNTINFYHKF